MRESIAHTFLYNVIIIFILIVFGILAATVNYYEAFKVNSNVIASIEKFEGYNGYAREEISQFLDSIGYLRDSNFNMMTDCPEREGGTVAISGATQNIPYRLCVYEYDDVADERNEREDSYYNYSVVSYIYVDLPIVEAFAIPVHTKAERIYRFTGTGGRS